MTKVIGITGFKRHGKGEVGAAIARLIPGTAQVGFADKLKISMMRSLGFHRTEAELIALADEAKVSWQITIAAPKPTLIGDSGLYDTLLHGLSGREMLQWFGTEGGRETFGDTFWIDQVLPNPAEFVRGDIAPERLIEHQLEQRYPGVPVLAITDVRFDNEAQRVKDVGGVMWEVERPDLSDSSADTHVSEAGVDPRLIDRDILNDGDLDNLQWRVEQALELEGLL